MAVSVEVRWLLKRGLNKNQCIDCLYKAIKIHLLALWALSQTQMTDMIDILQRENSLPFL